ncbi:MAG: hypothetical protein K1X39_03965 [Thermoflexales bacterium]|nr:hypothetical protein [Thermoflexales bacterium]
MLTPLSRAARLAAPAAALGCGVIAMAGRALPTALALALGLACVAAWQFWRAALIDTDWAPLRARWRDWQTGEPLPRLPYTEAGSGAEALSVTGGKFRAFVSAVAWPQVGALVAGAAAAFGLALLLAWALNPLALVLTVLALFAPQLVLLARGGRAARTLAALDMGAVEISLPFWLGIALSGGAAPTLVQLALGVGVGVAWAGLRSGPWPLLWQGGTALGVATLVAARHTVGAFLFTLCWLPQVIGGLGGVTRGAGRWLLLGLLVAAFAFQI